MVWREQSSSFKCAVIEGDPKDSPIADAKLIVVPCGSSEEAHFLAAALNSSPARLTIESYVVKVQISTHILKYVAVPAYDSKDPLHKELAALSRRSHHLVDHARYEDVEKNNAEIDRLAAKLWGLTNKELRRIQNALNTEESEAEASENE